MSHKQVTVSITGGSDSRSSSPTDQVSTKTARKPLGDIQKSVDKENLAGRPIIPIKDRLTKEQTEELLEVKPKKRPRKKSPPHTSQITEEDLTSSEPSENYWKALAEKRRIALEDALKENEELCLLIEELREKHETTERMLSEANSFVEVVKDMLTDNNDTGIDVKDVSSADDTADVSNIAATSDVSTEDPSTSTLEDSVAEAKD